MSDEKTEDEQFEYFFAPLGKAVDAAWLRTKDASFADAAREYKLVETEFVMRAGEDAFLALETKRRVVESIFKEAVFREEPFDTCRALWDDLVRLGFTDIERRSMMSWFYADCCRQNEQFELGLAIIDPIVAELERLLADPLVEDIAAEYYREQLERFGKLVTALKKQSSRKAD